MPLPRHLADWLFEALGFKQPTANPPPPPYPEEEMTWKRKIAVFNTNPEGKLVIRLADVEEGPGRINYHENQIRPDHREKLIRAVQDNLPKGHTVVGVSNLVPSVYGQGGAYIFPVRITPPAPSYEIDVGPPAKSLSDLTSQTHSSRQALDDLFGDGY